MTHITISGPGQTFDVELEVIKRALQQFGFIVEVSDDYPFVGNERFPTIDDFMEKSKERVKKTKIHIQTKHVPWGG
ncbi:MAG TPA: hypothetical protein VFM18_16550 [Methanosarcina sp.]|nr:hypothetical protein [Methanosarcina sp.]